MKPILLIASFVVAFTASAQKINPKIKFQQGQKLEMISKVNTVMSMEMMGQSMDTKVDAVITRSFDVEDVKSGLATIEHKVKRLQLNMDIPLVGNQSFDSDNEADMKGDGGKAMEKALKNKYAIQVDASGKIAAIKVDDDNPNKSGVEEKENMMSGAMSQIGAGVTLPKVGESSEFKIFPAKEISKGETWFDSTETGKIVYTLSEISNHELIVSYTEEGKTNRKQEANGMEITMSSIDKTTGRITIDKATGLLKEKTSTTDSQGTMEVMGQEMPMTTKTTTTTTLVAK